MTDEQGLRFAERALALIETGRKSATYKLATLLALIDVVAESSDPVAGAPTMVSGRQVAHRVIELYWPQSAIYSTGLDGKPVALRQSPHNDIPAKLHEWRQQHGLGSRASFESARRADPESWERLERELVITVLRMPLPKLQRFGEGRQLVEDRFIYDYGWRDEEPPGTFRRVDFDDGLYLRPGVGEYLVRLAPLLRPAVQSMWADFVARRNPELVDEHRLDDFLFGATRVDLTRLRGPLCHIQGRLCFYCDRPLRSEIAIDHFVPWSRHPDNTLDNLVATHRSCNGSKAASIAGLDHLERWIHRLRDPVMEQISIDSGWLRHPERSRGIVSATYLWLPEGSRLWVGDLHYETIDSERVRHLLAA